MRRFLYYFPSLPGINPRMMAERGVLSRFTADPTGALIEHAVTGIDAGPAGSGCIVAATTQPPSYAPERQRWVEGPKFWVGLEDAPPRPQDLEREVGITGYDTTLADGMVWRVPLLRRWDCDRMQHDCNLPTALVPVMEKGAYRYTRQVRPEYQGADALAERTFAAFVAEKTLPLDTAYADAAELLAVNYRIGIEEAGLLGLFDEETVVRVLAMSVDLPRLQKQAAEMRSNGLQYAEPVIEVEE